MGDGMSIDKAIFDEVPWTQPELPIPHDPSCNPEPSTVYSDEDCTGCWCHDGPPSSILQRTMDATMEDLRASILARGSAVIVLPDGPEVQIGWK